MCFPVCQQRWKLWSSSRHCRWSLCRTGFTWFFAEEKISLMSLPRGKNANSMLFARMNALISRGRAVMLHRLTRGGIRRYRGRLWESVRAREWARRDGGTVHPVPELEGTDRVHLCLLSGLPELWQESEEEADWAKSASCRWQSDGVK